MNRKPESKKAAAPANLENFQYYLPVLLVVMLIGVILVFGEFIFSNQMLYGSDTINAGIFFRHFYVEYFNAHGQVPVWNPFIFGGMPYIDAFHGDIFYPLSILKFFGNFYRMLGFNLVLHILLAGIIMFFTARQFRLGRLAATLSALAYMFSGLLISLVAPGHDGKIFVTTLFPLTILFLDRGFEKKPVLNFTLLGLVIGVIILSPHPQLSYYSLWSIAAYSIFKLILRFRERKSPGSLVMPSALLAGAVVIGLMVSAVQFYPGYIYTTKYSPRADTKRGYEWATSWSMHEEEAFSLVVPEFSGSTGGEGDYYWGKNVFKDNSEYAGVIPLMLALLAVLFSRRREAYFFAGLALFALIYALGGTTPLFKIFYYLIPNVKSLRAPSTIMFIFLFSVSLLAGMGLQYLIEKGREASDAVKRKIYRYLAICSGALFVFAFLYLVAGETMLSFYSSLFYGDIKNPIPGQPNLSKWQLALMNLPNIKTGLWIVFFFVAAVSVSIYLFLSRKTGMAILLVIPLLAMSDGVRFSSRFVRTFDYRQQFSPNPMTNYINGLPGKFRILNLGSVPHDYLPFFGIEVVTGYHGNQLRWYDDLLGGPSLTNQGNPHFLNLVGTRYILAPSNAKLPPNYFGAEPLVTERDFSGAVLYKNSNAFPRAYLVSTFEVIPERKDIYPRVLGGTADLRKKVFLEKEPTIAVNSSDTVGGIAEVVSYAIDSVVVDIQTTENSILVLTDNYYFAWEAFVDGVKTEVLRANGSFRAVPVAAGSKQVIFKYNRSLNNRAKAITYLALLLIASVVAVHLFQSSRERKKPPTKI
ncbi:MAG: hypothetical protein AB1690_12345 [Candidatus Zixiibacteriota bacterium]